MRQIDVIWTLIKLKISRLMVYRLNFFGAVFVDGTLFLCQMAMFAAIYGEVDEIAGWGRAETLMFIGTFALIDAINMTVFFFGINELSRLIRTGDLDGYLTRPINALFRLTFENVDLGSSPLIPLSIGIISYGASLADFPIHAWQVGGYVGFVLLMTLLWYDIMVILRSIVFFAISAAGMDRVEGALLEMCMKVPGVAFKGGFKVLFMVILPYGLIATVPVELLAGTLTWQGGLYSVGIVAAFTALALGLFHFGVRNYKSASS